MSSRKFRSKDAIDKYGIILPSKRNISITLDGDSESDNEIILIET